MMGTGAKAVVVVIAGLFIVAVMNNNDINGEATGGKDPDSVAQNANTSEAESNQPKPPPEPRSPWFVSKSTSKIDDSPTVVLKNYSNEIISGRFGRDDKATLVLRCMENTTNLYFTFAKNFMADIGSYGNVTYRLDDEPARTINMGESSDNEALGLWSGGRSIPVIKQMFGHDELTVRATPYNESSITMTFNVSDLQEDIKPLREACHW